MTPHYETPEVTLWHGDCLDVLARIGDASIDAVVTDPPYGLEFMGKGWDAPWKQTPNAWATRDKSEDRTGKTSSPFLAAQVNKFAAGLPFQQWCELWTAECLRVLKPGGMMLSFGGTRTWHRLACAIEDAGFEVRDSIAWLYGSGFPKSLDVSKAIDKAARGVPQGAADPTSPNHGKYRTTTTEGKRWHGDSGQGYGAGGSRFLADGQASGSATEPAAYGGAETVAEAQQWQGWGTALKPAFEPMELGCDCNRKEDLR
jgi:site-specific DNA-methyltransferase (adenine-specific)